MILSISGQAQLFLITVAAGAVMGFIYDFIRIARRLIKHSYAMVQVEDFLYWLLVAIAAFLLMLSQNYGEIRFFSIAGITIGMVIYFLTISNLFLKVSVSILNFVKRVFMLFFEILMTPFRILVKIFAIPLHFIERYGKKVHKSNKRVLKKISSCAKIRFSRGKRQIRAMFKKI